MTTATLEPTTPAASTGNSDTLLIDATTLSQWLQNGEAYLVDVREVREHSSQRIAGACLMPLSALEPSRLPNLAGRKLVLHCLSGARSQQAAGRIAAATGQTVYQLRGGITAWTNAGLPVLRDSTGPTMFAVQRQAFVVIGLGVLTGLILAYTLNLGWLLFSGFFACGLLMAGLTGLCPLAMLLAKMPWNRTAPTAAKPAAGSCCAR
ncbi:MAG: rhodanese family protein [Phycisphaeraceae bacterium]